PRARPSSMARRTSCNSLTTSPAYRGRTPEWAERPGYSPATMASPTHGPVRLEELRVLDGPNLYFTRPAVKLTIAAPGLIGLYDERMAAVVVRGGLAGAHKGGSSTPVRVGDPGTDQRRRTGD